MAKYVIENDRLIGFVGMPAEPFMWLRIQMSKEDPYSLQVLKRSGEMNAIIAAPEGVFSEATAISSVAVSEELVQLFDKYGVPFPVDMSELFAYHVPPAWDLVEQKREFRFVNADDLRQMQVSFIRLVDVWLDVYAPVKSTVKVDEAEMHVLQAMVMDFMMQAAYGVFVNHGWSQERMVLVRHMFTPSEWMKVGVSAEALEEREALRNAAGYRKLMVKRS